MSSNLMRACALAIAVVLAASCGSKPTPNVILITLDTTRADRLSCYGYERETTPNLDAIAAEATLYTQAFGTSSWTLPTHASIFTGKLPRVHGARYEPDGPLRLVEVVEDDDATRYTARGLSLKEHTLATILKREGYSTGAVVAGPWLASVFGLSNGFDTYDDANIEPLIGRRANDVTDRAIEWIGDSPERPFFLFLNYFDPHAPYLPPKRFQDVFLAKGTKHEEVPRAELLNVMYDSEIRYVDHHIGRLVARLKELGIYEQTSIIITADHGELMGENNQWGHGKSLSLAELHIPLIVKLAGNDSPEVNSLLIQQTDILPLILDSLDIPLPPGIQGSFPPTISHPIVAEVNPFPTPQAHGDWRAIIQDDYKYSWNSLGTHTLSRISADPGEARNLMNSDGSRASEMHALLMDYLEGLPQPLPHDAGEGLDSQTLKSLEALGYVGDGE